MCVNVSLPICTSKYNKEQKLSLGIADIGKSKRSVTMHCPENNLNPPWKKEPVMTGAENCTLCLHTVYLFKKPDTVYTVESAPAEIG